MTTVVGGAAVWMESLVELEVWTLMTEAISMRWGILLSLFGVWSAAMAVDAVCVGVLVCASVEIMTDDLLLLLTCTESLTGGWVSDLWVCHLVWVCASADGEPWTTLDTDYLASCNVDDC